MATDISPTAAATTVGGNVTELDAQSVTFFQTACGGLSGLQDLQTSAQGATTPAEVGKIFTDAGDKMVTTGQQLSSTPPPTFEGGDQLATTMTSVLTEFGTAIKDFGTKTAALDPNDPNAQQQFLTGLQEIGQKVQGAGQSIELSPDVKAAVEKQVPECAFLAESSSASGSAAPTS